MSKFIKKITSENMQNKNPTAILTGAGRKKGIGAATARMLAGLGYNIFINCLGSCKKQADEILNECRELNVEAELHIGDVRHFDTCTKMALFVKNKWGRADALINCAGITKVVSYSDIDLLETGDFDTLFSVNVTSQFLMVKAFYDLLQKSQDGVVINISSTAGLNGMGSSIAYTASKGGVNALTLALAQALSPNVRVNAVLPGFVDSSWWEEGAFAGKHEEYSCFLDNIKKGTLLNRVVKPIDVAKVIVGLIKNSSITGELVKIDAGDHICKEYFKNNMWSEKKI